MKSTIYLALTALALGLTATSCGGDTPQSLADESKELHQQLETAQTKADSSAIFNKIIDVENRARSLGENEFKEYTKLK